MATKKFEIDANMIADIISIYIDELSNWGTTKLDKKNNDDVYKVTTFVEDVINGDKDFVIAIIKFNDNVKNEKDVQEWLIDSIFTNSGNPTKQKEFLNRLRNTIGK